MTNTAAAADWSPAHHPDAIAVSEAYQWFSTIRLQLHRLRSDPEPGPPCDSRQLDARLLVVALMQLTNAAKLMGQAAETAGNTRVSEGMVAVRDQFLAALPGIKHMRDGLTHYEDWARGQGRQGPQAKLRKSGADPADIARDFWYFGFDQAAGTVTFGPYSFGIAAAEQAARELYQLIYQAGQALDVQEPTEPGTGQG